MEPSGERTWEKNQVAHKDLTLDTYDLNEWKLKHYGVEVSLT